MTRMDFETWFKKLQEVAVKDFGYSKKAVKTMDKKAWKSFYDDGLKPEEALEDDVSNA
jgi:hypothetical protein